MSTDTLQNLDTALGALNARCSSARSYIDILVTYEELDRRMAPLTPGERVRRDAERVLHTARGLRRALGLRLLEIDQLEPGALDEALVSMHTKALSAHQHLLRRERTLSLYALLERAVENAETPHRFVEIVARWLPHLSATPFPSFRSTSTGWKLGGTYRVADRRLDRRRHMSALWLVTDDPNANNLIVFSTIARGSGRPNPWTSVARQVREFPKWLDGHQTLIAGAGYGGAAAQCLAVLLPSELRDRIGVVTFGSDALGETLPASWSGREHQVRHYTGPHFNPAEHLPGSYFPLSRHRPGATNEVMQALRPSPSQRRHQLLKEGQLRPPYPSTAEATSMIEHLESRFAELTDFVDRIGRNTLYNEVLPMMKSQARVRAIVAMARAKIIIPVKYRFSAQLLEALAAYPEIAAPEFAKGGVLQPYLKFVETRDPTLAQVIATYVGEQNAALAPPRDQVEPEAVATAH